MQPLTLRTNHLELKPLPLHAAAILPEDRQAAGDALGAQLAHEWPDPHLHGVLKRHAGGSADAECFGVWVMIERSSNTVVGDLGFRGPPDETGTIELGYSVVPSRRRRGYATEAAAALARWADAQPTVRIIVAGCDPANVASVRILENVGFERTGEASGEIRWRYRGEDA
jgi:ribosomal-protein-alanine N-acetyltransferase